jgi:hypothetical protein
MIFDYILAAVKYITLTIIALIWLLLILGVSLGVYRSFIV